MCPPMTLDFTVTTLDSPEGGRCPSRGEWDGSIWVPFCIKRAKRRHEATSAPQKIHQFSPENINSVRRVVPGIGRFNLPSGVAHSIGSDYPGDDKASDTFYISRQ